MANLTVVTTDHPADADDIGAIKVLISLLKQQREKEKAVGQPLSQIVFIVNGPHPDLSAAALRELYKKEIGEEPLIAMAKGVEQKANIIKRGDVANLITGEPMQDHPYLQDLQSETFKPENIEDFFSKIDELVRSGDFHQFNPYILSPLETLQTFYDPNRSSRSTYADSKLRDAWEIMSKSPVVQNEIIPTPLWGTKFVGFNAGNSGNFIYDEKAEETKKIKKTIPQKVFEMFDKSYNPPTYFQGGIAKWPEFKFSIDGDPGVKATNKANIKRKQIPWIHHTQDAKTAPSPEHLNPGSFSEAAIFPFLMHMCVKDFGAKRFGEEVFGKTDEEIKHLMESFLKGMIADVVHEYNKTGMTELITVEQARDKLFKGMLEGGREYFKSELPLSIQEFYDHIREKLKAGVAPYPLSMALGKAIRNQPFVNKINDLNEKVEEAVAEKILDTAIEKGAEVTGFDVGTVILSHIVNNDKDLQDHFKDWHCIYISEEKMESLKNDKPEAYMNLVVKYREIAEGAGLQLSTGAKKTTDTLEQEQIIKHGDESLKSFRYGFNIAKLPKNTYVEGATVHSIVGDNIYIEDQFQIRRPRQPKNLLRCDSSQHPKLREVKVGDKLSYNFNPETTSEPIISKVGKTLVNAANNAIKKIGRF